ncbi:MAG: hypothetical protein ACFBRM_02375 [Pikeienuella sp.]
MRTAKRTRLALRAGATAILAIGFIAQLGFLLSSTDRRPANVVWNGAQAEVVEVIAAELSALEQLAR